MLTVHQTKKHFIHLNISNWGRKAIAFKNVEIESDTKWNNLEEQSSLIKFDTIILHEIIIF